MLSVSRIHNRPPEAIPADTRAELRQRLERDYADVVKRCLDLEVAMTQLPEEVTFENAGQITDFLGKQINPFLKQIKIYRDQEKRTYLELERECDDFFTARMQRRLSSGAAQLSARMAVYEEKERRIAREIQLEEKRLAEEELRAAQEEAIRQRIAAQETAPLDRSEAREHIQAAKKAEAEAAAASRIINAPPDPGHIRGDYGATGYLRDSWKAEIEDIKKVPWKYLILDEKKVNDDIAAAVREAKRTNREPPGISIPGLRIYHEAKFVARG